MKKKIKKEKKAVKPDVSANTPARISARVVGLGFTSPRVADVAIDKKRFRTYIHESGGKVSELSDFLKARDSSSGLKNVVLVTSLHEMHRLSRGKVDVARPVKKGKDGKKLPQRPPKQYDVTGIDAFVVFDDAFSLRAAKGIKILDVDPDSPAMGVRRVQITAHSMNQALRGKEEDVVIPAPKSITHRFRHPITFRELTVHVHELVHHKVPELQRTAIEKLVGLCRIYTWKRVKKQLLGMGQVNDGVLELDQFCEHSQAGELLRGAYRAMADDGISLKKAVKKYGADKKDLAFIVKHVPPKPGMMYHKKKVILRPVKDGSKNDRNPKNASSSDETTSVRSQPSGVTAAHVHGEDEIMSKNKASKGKSDKGGDKKKGKKAAFNPAVFLVAAMEAAGDHGRTLVQALTAALAGMVKPKVAKDAAAVAIKKAKLEKDYFDEFLAFIEDDGVTPWYLSLYETIKWGKPVALMAQKYSLDAEQLASLVSFSPAGAFVKWAEEPGKKDIKPDPKPAKGGKGKKAAKSDDDEDEEEEGSEEEGSEEESESEKPAKKGAKKGKAKKGSEDEDEEESEEGSEEESEESEDEDEKPAKKGKGKPAAKGKKGKKDESESESESESEEESEESEEDED